MYAAPCREIFDLISSVTVNSKTFVAAGRAFPERRLFWPAVACAVAKRTLITHFNVFCL